MQIRHYTRVIWRSFGLILLFAGIAAGVTYAVSKFVIPPVYQASTLIQVDAAGDSSTVFADNAQAVSYALLVTTTPVLKAAANELHGITADQLKTAVSASPLASSSIIEIRAQASDPQQAADIANVVAQNFIAVQVAKATSALQTTLQQTSQSMNTAKTNLTNAQTQLAALQISRASAAAIAQQTNIVNTDQLNYDSLLTNYQQIQQRLLRVNSLLIQAQKALPPAAPLSPRTSLDTLVAGALGALLVIVFALVRDWVDNSIRTPEDVANLTLLEPLASMPLSKKTLASVAAPGSDPTIEQASILATMTLSAQQKRPAAILLTSLQGKAGTTTIAVSLAISFAQSGKRVLLIDANLHRPALPGYFQRPSSKGLPDALAEIARLREGERFSWLNQWATEIPNLWLLPAGQRNAYPGGGLRSPELGLLVRGLLGTTSDPRERGIDGILDYIIFDAADLREGTNPIALTAVTDYTVLVIGAGKEHGEALNKVGLVFQRLGSPVAGVVVNRQTPRHRPYFYAESPLQATPLHPENLSASSALLSRQAKEPILSVPQVEEGRSAMPLAFAGEPGTYLPHVPDGAGSMTYSFPPSTPLPAPSPSGMTPPRPAQNR